MGIRDRGGGMGREEVGRRDGKGGSGEEGWEGRKWGGGLIL